MSNKKQGKVITPYLVFIQHANKLFFFLCR
nr:MAG TPA: hypothetical protein [Caudoviricetes sp.]